ncbi:MAG: hypothetical protein JWR84_276 [Caulobacter sp.]|nr:hypothetical protein [Caulobacter sp.]
MHFPLWLIISFSITAAVTGLAVLKGGPPERLCGAFLFVACQVTYLIPDRRWIDVQFAVMILDVFVLLVFVALALRADRWWPLWMSGLQGLAVIIHLAFWAQHRVISLTYSIALNIIGYAVLIPLLLGTLAYMQRRRPPSPPVGHG